MNKHILVFVNKDGSRDTIELRGSKESQLIGLNLRSWRLENMDMCSEFLNLYDPYWDDIQHHQTIPEDDIIWYSLGVNKANYMFLAGGFQSGKGLEKEVQRQLKFHLEEITHNYRIRKAELEANKVEFEVREGMIDREKYYKWCVGAKKPIPDEFSLQFGEKTEVDKVQDIQRESSEEPIPRKGNPESIDRWVKWKVESQGRDKAGNILFGYKTNLINEASKYSLGETTIRGSWKRCGYVRNKLK